MEKKGTIILIKNNVIKGIYIHRHAEIKCMGKRLVKLCHAKKTDGLKTLYDKLIMVKEENPMTKEQREAYKRYIPEKYWTNDLTWTQALGYTIDATKPLFDEFPYAVDYTDFIPSWRSRFQYCLNLDNGTFQIAKYGLECIAQNGEDFYKNVQYPHKIAPVVLGKFSIDQIPDDWMEQCEAYWDSLYLCYLPMDEAAKKSGNGGFAVEDQHNPDKVGFYIGNYIAADS